MHTKVLFRRRSGEVTTDSQSAGQHRSGQSGRGRLAGLGVAVLMLGGGVAAVSSASASAAAPAAVSVSPALSVATMSGVRQSKVIGYSVQGRAIVAHEIGNPKAPTKDLVLGSMHGYYERAGEQVVASLKAMAIPTNLDLWVIPTINPDGDAMGQRANAHNVDLNRDWPNNWVHIPGNPADKFDNHGNGSAPLSQPETRAMYDFLRWLRPARVVSMHQPLDGVDTTDGGGLPQGRAFRDALAAHLGLPLKALTCFGGCHGSMTGWLTNYTSTVGITVEFGSSESSSYLQGQTARGIVSALGVGVKAWSAPTPGVPTVIGVLDKAVVSTGAIRVQGWSLDPAYSSPSSWVTVQVDGHTISHVRASSVRGDVNRTMHVVGRHGFVASVKTTPGRHRVCVIGNTYASSASRAATLTRGCKAVTVPPVLLSGHVDQIVGRVGGGILVSVGLLTPSTAERHRSCECCSTAERSRTFRHRCCGPPSTTPFTSPDGTGSAAP